MISNSLSSLLRRNTVLKTRQQSSKYCSLLKFLVFKSYSNKLIPTHHTVHQGNAHQLFLFSSKSCYSTCRENVLQTIVGLIPVHKISSFSLSSKSNLWAKIKLAIYYEFTSLWEAVNSKNYHLSEYLQYFIPTSVMSIRTLYRCSKLLCFWQYAWRIRLQFLSLNWWSLFLLFLLGSSFPAVYQANFN